MHLLHVVGARPNFMKAAPVLAALAAHRVEQTLVHTGQHYDVKLSDAIFRELGLPDPDINLGVGSGSHAEQTAQIIVGIERCLVERKPDMLIVVRRRQLHARGRAGGGEDGRPGRARRSGPALAAIGRCRKRSTAS